MQSYLIQNATLVNEGKTFEADVYIKEDKIEQIGVGLKPVGATRIEARGRFLFPGLIDDQVHFREPGLTHKADIASESKAALAGGVTAYMEMPNTAPPTVNRARLQEKFDRAAQTSFVNYSFYIGATNDNLSEITAIDETLVCGIKIFMGSSTGDLLVDKEEALEKIFQNAPILIATHCEDEATIRANLALFREKYGDDALTPAMHPQIRSAEGCYLSSSKAVGLAQKYNARLHVLHISTARELELFRNDVPLKEKRITTEACLHHLWFSEEDYATSGNFIKWNPAVKTAEDRAALWRAVNDGRIDVLATDHAPHTLDEKNQPYLQAPSGGPLIQHWLPALMQCVQKRDLTVETLVQKTCHAPADCFQIDRRGYLREGYFADLVLLDATPWTVKPDNILYKCGWSPFNDVNFSYCVENVWVNGVLAYKHPDFFTQAGARPLRFLRG